MTLQKLPLLVCLLVSSLTTGCGMAQNFTNPFGESQSNTADQSLPSAFHSRDEIQFFPAGPEGQLPNQKRALEQYRLEQQQQGDTVQE